MDLETALRTVTSPLYLPGTSDRSLVELVQAHASPAHRDVHPVPVLHGGNYVRPADALLSLAMATRPRYQADVHDAHTQWGLLRYLGVFEELQVGRPALGLSDAGRRIAGNQRRVLSEELGIGFATLLAAGWLMPGSSLGSSTVATVDIDVLLSSLLGRSLGVELIGRRRPDYLIVAADPQQGIRLGLLECKGTKQRSYMSRQLANASEQLAGLTLKSATLPGLAVSSVVADSSIEYFAVQRFSGRTYTSERSDLWEAPALDTTQPSFDIPRFSSAQEAAARVEMGGDGVGTLGGPALAASWAMLADLSGNEQAFTRWSSTQTGLFPRVPRPRQEHQGPDGRIVRGVSSVVSLPGGRLEAVFGVLDYVDDALQAGDSVTMIEAQRRANLERSNQAGAGTDDVVAAYGSGGSALLLLPG